MRVVVAVDDAGALVDGLRREGVDVIAQVAAAAPALAAADGMLGADAEGLLRALAEADALVIGVSRATMSPTVVALCDRAGTRVVPLVDDAAGERLAAACGLEAALGRHAEPWRVAEALAAGPSSPAAAPQREPRPEPRLVAVWGPAGAPGRSTVATELAVELARGGRHVALVDADTHAPSLALTLGLADEGPGFAAACRQAELGGLDARELARIAVPLGLAVDVLTGINRPSRWPELSEGRVGAALAACRDWADYTVVDVASSLERDEEIMSDLDGPRRNAATLAALRAADLVVAVVAADPVGIARFLRGHAELRATIGATRVAVVANRLRPGTLGIDARGQVRRTLDRFGGIEDVWFLPQDPRSADAAILAARPIAEVAPRSPFTAALRRFVGEAVVPAPATAAAPERGGGARRRGLLRGRDESAVADAVRHPARAAEPAA